MERTNSKKVLLVSALVILFLAQNYLQSKVAAFQYLDELCAVVSERVSVGYLELLRDQRT